MRHRFIAAVLVVTAVSFGCGRTGLNVPDTRVLPPPFCSQDRTTVLIHLIPDAIVPAPERVQRVDWFVHRRCAISFPPNPQDGIGERRGLSCYVTQYVNGNTEISGDCQPPGFVEPSPSWRVGNRPRNRPNDIGFVMEGSLQGQLCVGATVTYTNGTVIAFGPRAWIVQVPSQIPEIVLWSRRNANATVSEVVPGSSAMPNCPRN